MLNITKKFFYLMDVAKDLNNFCAMQVIGVILFIELQCGIMLDRYFGRIDYNKSVCFFCFSLKKIITQQAALYIFSTQM